MLIRLLIFTILVFGVVTIEAQESITIEYGTFDQFDILNRNLTQGPDDTTFAIATTDGSIFLWDWKTRSVIQQLEPPDQELEWEPLLWSEDGLLIAGTTSQDVILWDTVSGQIIQKIRWIQEGKEITSFAKLSLAFSSDNRLIAAGFTSQSLPSEESSELFSGVWVWEVPTGQLINSNVIPRPGQIAFSADNQWLAMTDGFSADFGENDIQKTYIWNLTTDELITLERTTTFSFSPDGNMLLVAEEASNILIFDAYTMIQRDQVKVDPLPLVIYKFEWISDEEVLLGLSHPFYWIYDGHDSGAKILLWNALEETITEEFATRDTVFIPHELSEDQFVFRNWSDKRILVYDVSEDSITPYEFRRDYPYSQPFYTVPITGDPIRDFTFRNENNTLATQLDYSRDWIFWDVTSGEQLPYSIIDTRNAGAKAFAIGHDIMWVNSYTVIVGPCWDC